MDQDDQRLYRTAADSVAIVIALYAVMMWIVWTGL